MRRHRHNRPMDPIKTAAQAVDQGVWASTDRAMVMEKAAQGVDGQAVTSPISNSSLGFSVTTSAISRRTSDAGQPRCAGISMRGASRQAHRSHSGSVPPCGPRLMRLRTASRNRLDEG